jgi:hypothetical protein
MVFGTKRISACAEMEVTAATTYSDGLTQCQVPKLIEINDDGLINGTLA